MPVENSSLALVGLSLILGDWLAVTCPEELRVSKFKRPLLVFAYIKPRRFPLSAIPKPGLCAVPVVLTLKRVEPAFVAVMPAARAC